MKNWMIRSRIRLGKMMIWSMAVLLVAVFGAGCSILGDPDSLFKDGKYSEAYTKFIERGGTNETRFRTEVMNGAFATRNDAGNQAIHDYYYAAECQKKLGNDALAQSYYKRVVDLSATPVRIPQNRLELIRAKFMELENSLSTFHDQELMAAGEYEGYSNQAGVPFSYYTASVNNDCRELEELLYATNASDIPNISQLRQSFATLSSRVKYYTTVGSSDSASRYTVTKAYEFAQEEMLRFKDNLLTCTGTTTYATQSLAVKEPQLVEAARKALGAVASAPASTTKSVTQDKSSDY